MILDIYLIALGAQFLPRPNRINASLRGYGEKISFEFGNFITMFFSRIDRDIITQNFGRYAV